MAPIECDIKKIRNEIWISSFLVIRNNMKKINKEIAKPDPNIYKLLGHKKSRRTKEDLKDKEIEILNLKYDTNKIGMMDYLS